MKRHGNLYDQAFTPENLYQGYLDAARHKRGSRSCHQFERSLGAQLADLHSALHDGSYKPRPYNTFQVFEPKPRLIYAPAFRDRVVQHAIYHVIRPIFDATFVAESFACRPGKGTHAAADHVQSALGAVPRDSYSLQIDIRKFYYRIDRVILRQIIERKIKDRRLVDVMMLFADQGEPLGIPIGNLLSQLYALIYLNPLDHYIKRVLKVRHYARYVDDCVLIGLTRVQSLSYRSHIIEFLAVNLGLELSKSTIAPVRRGANFVGYRTWASRRFVRRHALFTFRRAAHRNRLDAVVSSLGHARRTASLRHMISYIKEHHYGIYHQLPKSLRRDHHL